MKRGDMPAAPIERELIMPEQGKPLPRNYPYGMTIRERMAMAAMQGLLASGNFLAHNEMAKEALDAADCLLYWQERTREGASDD